MGVRGWLTQRSVRVLCSAALLLAGFGCSSLPPQKRVRHLVETDYSVTDGEFARSTSHLLGAPLVEGNKIVELLNGDRIFSAMLEGIRRAQKTISMENYIWSSGQVSTQFVAALSERARAGIKVHLIVDAVGSAKLGKWDREQLRAAGAELLVYNPPMPLKLFRLNHRTHRKILVIDGKVGFTGGVCLSDDWQGNAEPGRWRETHLQVEGPVVAQMQAVFTENWLQLSSETLHGDDYFPPLNPAGQMTAQFYRSGPRDAEQHARMSYLMAIAAARHNIRMAHSYFVPDGLLIESLLEARRRGIRIQVLVPSHIDNVAVRRASRSRWRGLLAAGVEFYEYQPTLYHCKIMIVDDIWATVGSVNIDERSFGINDEANLNVLNQPFAAKLIESFEADKSQSQRLTAEAFRNRGWLGKCIDHFVGLFRAHL